MELRAEVKELLIETAKDLKGSMRRLFMARTVRALGEGGQRLAERELGWNRGTIGPRSTRTGTRDYLHQCIRITRPQTESKSTSPTYSAISLPSWTGRVKPTHNARTNRLYTRLTATEVRRQLIGTFGYRDDELPTAETSATKLNELGYALKKVAKSQPQKNCPKPMPSLPKSSTEMRRQMPLPTCYGSQWMESATVKVGPFARGGKSRVPPKAADHDFQPEATVTPVGIFLPASDELFLYGVTSKVTSDCLVDRLVSWWETVKERFSHIKTLLINLDNGASEPQSAYPVHAPSGGVCTARSSHDTPGVLSAIP